MEADPHRATLLGLRDPAPNRYDPWRDLRENWPHIQVVLEPMTDRLLGWTRYPVIGLRVDTTASQRRCTLAHEIVHLERGIADCGPWSDREERQVHAVASRRLIGIGELASIIGELGGAHDLAALGQRLDVDRETLLFRLRNLTGAERRVVAERMRRLWPVA